MTKKKLIGFVETLASLDVATMQKLVDNNRSLKGIEIIDLRFKDFGFGDNCIEAYFDVLFSDMLTKRKGIFRVCRGNYLFCTISIPSTIVSAVRL
jgi:hypothetical protein